MTKDRWGWLAHDLHTIPRRTVHDRFSWAYIGTRRVRRPRATWKRAMKRVLQMSRDLWKIKHMNHGISQRSFASCSI